MEGKYKVEEFESDFLGNLENLKKYLNEKASQGWSCISVTTITSLGWTLSVVWETPDALPAEKKDDIFSRDEPVKNNIDICEKRFRRIIPTMRKRVVPGSSLPLKMAIFPGNMFCGLYSCFSFSMHFLKCCGRFRCKAEKWGKS